MVVSIVLLGLQELLALGEQESRETDGDGETGGNPEDGLPGLSGTADSEVGAGSEHVAERVTLLKDTGHQTTGVDWAVFEGHGDGVTVDSAHEETEERTDSEKLLEGGGVDGCDLEETHFGGVS